MTPEARITALRIESEAAARRPMVECARPRCGTRFYDVPARGERAPFCLDCADEWVAS